MNEIELPKGNERILFVDDEPAITKMAKMMLERLGYQVTALTNSSEAISLFQEKPENFDLVITDMTMPQITGEQLAVELMKSRADIPIIICTGYSSRMSKERASEIGIKAFAMKPFIKNEFAQIIRDILDK